jgi:hypothetical protein
LCSSSSPISATLKRARVLFGSGKSIICPVIHSLPPFPGFPHPSLHSFFFAPPHPSRTALLVSDPLPPWTLFFFLFVCSVLTDGWTCDPTPL